MERHRIGIVIPALNEAKTITSIVSKVSRYGLPIVVDDGSIDGTGKLARTAGATVVRHEFNLGYDQALNSGFTCAEKIGCEYVITMDADGQHDPAILETFIRSLDDGADIVVGYRDRRQRIAEHIFGWVAASQWGIYDPLCGMKAYRIGLYRALGHFDCYSSIGTELTLYAAKKGGRIAQVPVITRERIDAPRFGKRFSSNKSILRSLWLGLRQS